MAHTRGPGRYSIRKLARKSSMKGRRQRMELRIATMPQAVKDHANYKFHRPGSSNLAKVGR